MTTSSPVRTTEQAPTGHRAAKHQIADRLGPRPSLLHLTIRAIPPALRRLDPRHMINNPVMFVVWLGAVLSTVLAVVHPSVFAILVVVWLWLTVLFANLAGAIAEGRGKAQAASLRAAKQETTARHLVDGREVQVPSSTLGVGDIVVVEAGEVIPGDGDIVVGVASVDESAITGESAPVIREAGGDRSAVTGGTTVLSDRIEVRITARPGESFLDRMIALVEGASRQKTPNEISLNILLATLSIVFVLAVATLQPFAAHIGVEQPVVVLIALVVCLIPTTIGALLSAIGIAGMDRLVQRNVLAMSGRAVEAAGDVNVLLLDKTGTITYGNRRCSALLPVDGVTDRELAEAALLCSLADDTPEGRSIVEFATSANAIAGEEIAGEANAGEDLPDSHSESDSDSDSDQMARPAPEGAEFVPFSAETRMSGVDLADGGQIRKGAASAALAWAVPAQSQRAQVDLLVDQVSQTGGTPLVVVIQSPGVAARCLGVIHLKDVVKEGVRERFAALRAMGIRTVMVTGDNAVTAGHIAAEAGVDDFIAEAKPEDKVRLIEREQAGGRLVAMAGDGTNDAPALAKADVGVAMASGTSAAKEAGNMVDLDSDPTKLIEIVEIGKQLLMTRGALTTFSIANDVAKYFAIIPAMFMVGVPQLGLLNVMRLSSPESAIASAVIFNALIIIVLVPLALRGVTYRAQPASQLLRRNLLIYGLGGLIAPFIGIKLIDLLLSLVPGL